MCTYNNDIITNNSNNNCHELVSFRIKIEISFLISISLSHIHWLFWLLLCVLGKNIKKLKWECANMVQHWNEHKNIAQWIEFSFYNLFYFFYHNQKIQQNAIYRIMCLLNELKMWRSRWLDAKQKYEIMNVEIRMKNENCE